MTKHTLKILRCKQFGTNHFAKEYITIKKEAERLPLKSRFR